MYTIKITTYEDGRPILDHIFHGIDHAEAEKFVQAHARYDEFFAATLGSWPFHGMNLTFTEEHTRD